MTRQMIECNRKDLDMMYDSVTYRVPHGVHPMDEAFRDPSDPSKAHPLSTVLSWHAVHKFSEIRNRDGSKTWFVKTYSAEVPSPTDEALARMAEGNVPEDYTNPDPVLESMRRLRVSS